MNDTYKGLEIAPLFPTPLLRVDIPPELSTACNVFDNTQMLHEKNHEGIMGYIVKILT